MHILTPQQIKAGLKQYRKDVPSVGTVTETVVDEFLAEGKICRGWTTWNGQKQFFHIIKSPDHYPEKSVFYADSEAELFEMTVGLGMQKDIDLKNLLTD